MRNKLGLAIFALAVACGNMSGGGGGGGNGGGGGGGTGGGGGGGAGGSGGEPEYTSGSRIKSRVMSTADGAKAFAGFYDSSLGTACAFGRAADDSLRCLPSVGAYAGSYFADSGCATPLAYSAGCAGAYASLGEPTSSCVDIGYSETGTRIHIYPVGAIYGGTVWAGTPATCAMTTAPAIFTVYSLGSELPASTFAAGSVDNAP